VLGKRKTEVANSAAKRFKPYKKRIDTAVHIAKTTAQKIGNGKLKFPKCLLIYFISVIGSQPGIAGTLFLGGVAFTVSARREKVLKITGGKKLSSIQAEKARDILLEIEAPESPIRLRAASFSTTEDALYPLMRSPPVRRQTGPRYIFDGKSATCVTDLYSAENAIVERRFCTRGKCCTCKKTKRVVGDELYHHFEGKKLF
jgi:hypothetical protein